MKRKAHIVKNKILHAARTKLFRQRVELDRKKEIKKIGLPFKMK
jgi:stalled ribosome alternative rescue factor ArfA